MAERVKSKDLNEKKMRAIELIINGENNTNIATKVGVSRQTIIVWRKDPIFIAELNKQKEQLKAGVKDKIMMNLNPIVDKMINLALKSKSEKISLDSSIYLLNRILGTPTNKTADVSENKEDNKTVNIDEILSSFNQNKDIEANKDNDKIIPINKKENIK